MERSILDLAKKHKCIYKKGSKQIFVSDDEKIYFKTGLTNNEVCAEIAAYDIARALDIAAARTEVAVYMGEIGIASYDIGSYEVSQSDELYSIKDFLHIKGFIQMCLFDYLVMNEDRSRGNWGIKNNCIAPLFDHNFCFGGEQNIENEIAFMKKLSSPFYVDNENDTKQDSIFDYIAKKYYAELKIFLSSLKNIENIKLTKYNKIKMSEQVIRLLNKRIQYINEKI